MMIEGTIILIGFALSQLFLTITIFGSLCTIEEDINIIKRRLRKKS